MGVLTKNAAGELVGVGLADHVGAGIYERLHYRSGAGCRQMQRQPVRIACAGDVARDVEQILGRERETGQQPPRHAPQSRSRVGAERVQGIAQRCIHGGLRLLWRVGARHASPLRIADHGLHRCLRGGKAGELGKRNRLHRRAQAVVADLLR